MKDLLNSFLTSTTSNVNAEKSVLKYRTHLLTTGFITSALLIFTFLGLSIDTTRAQSSAFVNAPISTADLPYTNWKSIPEYTEVINSEKTSNTQILTNPNLTTEEFALYTGYDRMLSYIQIDLANNKSLEDMAPANFKRVKTEAPNDAILKNMKMDQFNILYDALNEKLHQ